MVNANPCGEAIDKEHNNASDNHGSSPILRNYVQALLSLGFGDDSNKQIDGHIDVRMCDCGDAWQGVADAPRNVLMRMEG